MTSKKEDLDLKKEDLLREPTTASEEKTLVEAIAEDLKKKRSLGDIRKEYLDKDYPRLVVETAIEEARQSMDKNKQHYDLSGLEPKDDDQKEKKVDEKNASVFPLVVIILIIWLGIMASFYLATPFGKAVDKYTTLNNEQSFIQFCTKDISTQELYLPDEREIICKIGDKAIKNEKTEIEDLKKQCNNRYYVIKEVNSCASTLNSAIQRYQS